MTKRNALCLALLLIGLLAGATGCSNQNSAPPSGATGAAMAASAPTLAAKTLQEAAPPSGAPAPEMGGTKAPVSYGFQVVKSYPHDPEAFTQGLLIENGTLYESTGLNGRSSLRLVDLPTGKVLKKVAVGSQYFAEGLTLFKSRLFQLTWQAHLGFIYDAKTFQKKGEFPYDGEGWGLTHDGKSLILSDGTNEIRFLDPTTFAVQRTIRVNYNGGPLTQLNELEYVKGEIWANVWQTDYIARIDPKDGTLLGLINFTGIIPASELKADTPGREGAVLNGIAYDAAKDKIYVTGKLWPKMYEVKVTPKSP